MAKRYSGSVTISIAYLDSSNEYRCYLSSPVTIARQGYRVRVGAPASLSCAVDSAEAYDAVAHAALSFLADESEESVTDGMLGILRCAEPSESGWHIARSAVRAVCDRDDRRQAV